METTRGRGRGEEWRLQGVRVEVRYDKLLKCEGLRMCVYG